MREQEHLMYQIISNISESNAPIVFKGALITKLILSENGYIISDRPTNDIDANWIGKPPTMDELTDVVNRSLESFGGSIYAEPDRSYASDKSAGIRFIDKGSGVHIISMDVSIKPVVGSRVYHYGEAAIRGVVPDAVLCDKIVVLSGDRVFRRAKDLWDVYALANCLEIRTTDIYDAIEKTGRTLGTFHNFVFRTSNLRHAYDKLQGIFNKPAFDSMYPYLIQFLGPFISLDRSPRTWRCNPASWDDTREKAQQIHRSGRDDR
jgi:hypothetical protein